MNRQIPESDWKIFRRIHPIALERYCARVLDAIHNVLSKEDLSAHEKYLKIYRLMRKRDKELASVFDDFRRSTAFFQISHMNSLKLLTPEEIQEFSEETQQVLNFLG